MTDLVELAAKQRHALLLKKIKDGQALTAAQMRELKNYQAQLRKAGKTPAADKTSTNDDARQTFLSKLRELAGAPGVDLAAAADRLGYTPDEFRRLLDADVEAGRVWRHAKTDALVRAGEILWKLADDGNTAAARQILESLQDSLSGGLNPDAMAPADLAKLIGEKKERLDYWYRAHGMPKNIDGTINLKRFLEWWKGYVVKTNAFDPHRVKMIELEPFFGVTRQTLNDWLKEGMPRNADKTFNLPEVIQWWQKRLVVKSKPAAPQVNPLAAKKAEKIQMELDIARGKLLDRVKVEMGLAARAAVIVNLLERKGGELPTLLANLPAEQIKPILDEFFAALRQTAANVPDDIAALLPERRLDKVKQALMEAIDEPEQTS